MKENGYNRFLMLLFNPKYVILPSAALGKLAEFLRNNEPTNSLEHLVKKISDLFSWILALNRRAEGQSIMERNCFLGKDTWKF